MGMKLKFDIENMGNIDKASVTIKPLTIIAGENSSGKTFVTKGLYTILDSVYKNHFLEKLIVDFRMLDAYFGGFNELLNKPSKIDIEFQLYFQLFLDEIKFFLIELEECQFEEQEFISSTYLQKFLKFDNKINTYFNDRLQTKKFLKYKDIIDNILEQKSIILKNIKNRIDIIIKGISSSLDIGFKKNFQITHLQNLINKNQISNLHLSLDTLGDIEIDRNQHIEFNLTNDGINEIQNVRNIVFFDSPVYIKIRKALEKVQDRLSYRRINEDKYLKGYPQYIEQFYEFIKKEYIDIPDFNLISQEIQEIINGRLEVNQGDINYRDNQNNIIPISLTAMGISNIGVIDLLLRNNIINKGSFLIMDEPEVHLHPKWQVFLAQILYKIAKSGANIIIATHSLDFLKAFENILKEDGEKAEDIIAINQMPYDDKNLELSELEKVGLVLDDLSKPYYDLYMQDI